MKQSQRIVKNAVVGVAAPFAFTVALIVADVVPIALAARLVAVGACAAQAVVVNV